MRQTSTSDYLAAFMAALADDPATIGGSFWVLDDATPALPDLLGEVGARYEVAVPRVRVPVCLVRHLPSALSHVDPETLSFLASDRYPTATAEEVASRAGLTMPDLGAALGRWADHLAAQRFGKGAGRQRRAYVDIAGVTTFHYGDQRAASILLPGLPLNADSWIPVVDRVPGLRSVDLPGLGASRGDIRRDPGGWLDALTSGGGVRLVGHSIGAEYALRAAVAHPQRVEELVLVAPYFLQDPPGAIARHPKAVGASLRRIRPARLSKTLTGEGHHAASVASAVEDLRRGSVARHTATLFARAATAEHRARVRELFAKWQGPVHVIVGSDDPLSDAGAELAGGCAHARVTVIDGAGHHPHLTHPEQLADLLDTSANMPVEEVFGLPDRRA
ncbi:MAG: alpha/beta hydrolase [Gordonia sp. (in: high G+C Gram-positive bacteria)]|uniref:alpha/beta fold hydrolase n=1 Tax=Gordonia sp. (in: high G+C Gram-positive bacteria) TaxID=84139 RepID=UPI0039E34BD4